MSTPKLVVFNGNMAKKKEEEARKREIAEKKGKLFLKSHNKRFNLRRRSDAPPIIFYGVKAVNWYPIHSEISYSDLSMILDVADATVALMRFCTLNEMKNMFPIGKSFDGASYGAKDYYSTIECFSSFDWDRMLGENVDKFLAEYYNEEIIQFCVRRLLLVDKMRKMEGKKSIASSFLENFPEIESFHYDKKHNGMISNKTGEKHKVTPRADGPRLKVLE